MLCLLLLAVAVDQMISGPNRTLSSSTLALAVAALVIDQTDQCPKQDTFFFYHYHSVTVDQNYRNDLWPKHDTFFFYSSSRGS